MIPILNKLLASIAFFFALQFSMAQKDSVLVKNDSLNKIILQEYNAKILKIEEQGVADSIKKVKLEAQLKSLKTTDNLQKEVLLKQLADLSNKENIRINQKKAQIEALRSTAIGHPVIGFFHDSLFLIYSKLGSFSAKDRAIAISSRINKLGDNLRFNPDSLLVSQSETSVDIIFGENIIMSVTESDAIWENISTKDLANKYASSIRKTVVHYKSETSLSTLLKEIGLALLVILIIILAINYILKLFKWTAEKIEHEEGKLIQGIKIKNYVLFDAKKEIKALITANRILKWIFILIIIYIALPVLFGIFPWTKDFAEILFGYILNPVKDIASGLWAYLPNLITILVIVIFFRYALRGINYLRMEIERGNLKIPGFYADWANPTHQIVKVLVYAFMVVVIFPYLPGSDSPIFQGVSVFLGFLITFGSAGSLSNIVAGLVLTYMRLFKIGDRVKIGDVFGDVIERTLLVTRVRTIKNEIISIPNSAVMASHTINYSSDAPEKGLILHTTVTIGYDVPWREVHQALIDAAVKTDLVLEEPKPFVLQTSLDDFYVSYQINAYIREANKQAIIYSNLHQHIQDRCNEAGIEIMSPHYRAARDGNTTTIPANYLEKDYVAPRFNVKVEKKNDQ
jgi:small-conductance mechanosensitive channel